MINPTETDVDPHTLAWLIASDDKSNNIVLGNIIYKLLLRVEQLELHAQRKARGNLTKAQKDRWIDIGEELSS